MQWSDIPPAARALIEARFGAVTPGETASAGLTAGVACSAQTGKGPVHIKAGPVDGPSAAQYGRERAAADLLPPDAPAPRLLWAEDVDGWHVLVHEYLPGRPADLSPGSPDITPVLRALRADFGVGGEHVATVKLAPMLQKAARFLVSPLGDTPVLRSCREIMDGWDPATLPGETFTHGDVHPGNLHATEDGVRLLDWGLSCAAPTWFDTAGLVLRLIAAGHTPAQAETLAAEIPAWAAAPERDVARYVAVMTGFAAWAAARGPERHRGRRAVTAAAGAAWLAVRA
ncbi:MAG: phosphotransferase [Streptosporangiales bacterium]|nr:phosphotransferase [Streptosporangiales bacterium]